MGQPFVPLLLHVAAPLCITPLPAPTPEVLPTPPDLDALRAAAFEEGQQEATASYEPRLQALEAELAAARLLLEQLPTLRKAALQQAAHDVAALVLSTARKVVGDSLTVHPDALPRLVHVAIGRLPDEDEIWIRVPVASVERVVAALPERHRSHVLADPTLETGCVVETKHASIDASLETVVEGLTAATAQWLSGRT